MQGWSDSVLTENGKRNAMYLGNRLKDVSFRSIYSSPSNRALETAKIISGARNIPIIINDNLKEIHLGDWEGKTQSYIERNYPRAYYSFWNAPHKYIPINGETFEDLSGRVLSALNEIVKENSTGNVLIVTHSVVIKSLLVHLKNTSIENLWKPPYIHDTSLTVMEITGENNRIVLEGDISHREVD